MINRACKTNDCNGIFELVELKDDLYSVLSEIPPSVKKQYIKIIYFCNSNPSHENICYWIREGHYYNSIEQGNQGVNNQKRDTNLLPKFNPPVIPTHKDAVDEQLVNGVIDSYIDSINTNCNANLKKSRKIQAFTISLVVSLSLVIIAIIATILWH